MGKSNLKEYYSEDLDSMLSDIITEEKYGEWAIIVKEILQRRAYEFGFPYKQIVIDAKKFVKNVDKIEIDELPKSSEGIFCTHKKKIVLNIDYFIKKHDFYSCLDNIFETLTHEVYHGVSYNGKKNLGLSYYDKWDGNWHGDALNEVFVETAADRATISRSFRDANHYRRKTHGYPMFTFTTNFLAASVGLSEKSILKAGLQSREKLIKAIMAKVDGDEYILDLLKKFEGSLDIIYNIYNDYSDSPEKYIKTKEELIKSSLITLYSSAYEIACYQIANDKRPLNSNYIAELSYRYLKMEKILQDSTDEFCEHGFISPFTAIDIYNKMHEFGYEMTNRIYILDNIRKNNSKIKDPKDKSILIREARSGVENLELLVKYQIPLATHNPKSISDITDNSEFLKRVMEEDFDFGKQWNNEKINNILENLFMQELEKREIKLENPEVTDAETKEIPTIKTFVKEKPKSVSLDKTQEFLPINDYIEEHNDECNSEKPKNSFKNKSGLFSKIKTIIYRIYKRIANRNLYKLDGKQPDDNSEYYANLVTNHLSRKEDELDKYKVDTETTTSYNSKNAKNKNIRKNAKEHDDR